MLDIDLIIKTLLILTLGIMSPGPDFFMVLRNSLTYGRMAGMLSAIGVASGCLISFTLVIIGLKILFAYQITKIILSLVCGLYLIYLGWMSIHTKPKIREKIACVRENAVRLLSYFRNGFLTNVLNPKLYSFCTAILAYIEEQHPTWATNTALIIGNAVIALVWFMAVSFILTQPTFQAMYFKHERMLNIALGIILIAVGIRVMMG
jgi:threonine/homoserine/homoserine lactone efflux protein